MSVKLVYVHNPEDPDAMELADLEAKRLRDEAAATGDDDLTIVKVLYVDADTATNVPGIVEQPPKKIEPRQLWTHPQLEGEVPDVD
jgi:hypothetical protein